MRTNLTVFAAGFLLALLFDGGPVGALAALVCAVVLASAIAGVRWRVEIIHAPGVWTALGRAVTALVGLFLLLLAAAYVYVVLIRGLNLRFDSPGWFFWGAAPLVGAALVWAAWSPLPRVTTTEETMERARHALSRRNLEL